MAWKATNLSKITEVLQKPEESPGLLFGYTGLSDLHSFNPLAPENNRALFLIQSAPDILT